MRVDPKRRKKIPLAEAAAHPLAREALVRAAEECGLAIDSARPLGQGGTGVVFRAADAAGHPVAVKVPNYGRWPAEATPKLRKRIRKEGRNLGLVESPVVPRLLGLDGDGAYLVRTFADGAPLYLFRRNVDEADLGGLVHAVLACVRQLFAAYHDHEHGPYVNLSLQANDVVCARTDDTYVVRYVDHASARREGDALSAPSRLGSKRGLHKPPERRKGPCILHRNQDYFALGTLTYFGVTGQMPYTNDEADPDRVLRTYLAAYPHVAQRVRDAFDRLGLAPELAAFVVRCLHPVAAERPTRFIEVGAPPRPRPRWRLLLADLPGRLGLGSRVPNGR